MNDPEMLMQAAAELARISGSIALELYRPGVASETKADGSPVTQADRRAERAAREWLARRFPEDSIVGEEFGEERRGARRRWIIDPIDGTKSFIRHVPLWGTLIAVEERGAIVAGAAFFPAVEELLVAAPGQGCWRNGARCWVSSVATLESATVLTTDDRFRTKPERASRWAELAAKTAIARTWGDCYGYLMVATGRAEAMLDDITNDWDSACMQPIITEAGGVFTDFRGEATAFAGSVIATNRELANQIRSIMNDKQSGTSQC